MPLYSFTEEEISLLKDLVIHQRQVRMRIRNHQPEPDGPSSGGYLALTPAAGIPALVDHSLGTGTGGTSDQDGPKDRPGYADCEVYQTVPVRDRDVELRSIGSTRKIYNPSRCVVPGHRWVPVIKDAFGSWWACYQPCTPTHPGTGTGTGTGTSSGGGGGGSFVTTPCCAPVDTPTTLYVTISHAAGAMLGHDGVYPMAHSVIGGNDVWQTAAFPWTSGTPWRIQCIGTTWGLGYSPTGAFSLCGPPFFAEGHENTMPGGFTSSQFDWVITETHP